MSERNETMSAETKLKAWLIVVLATIALLAIGVAGVTGEMVIVIHNESAFVMTRIELNGDTVPWTQVVPDVPPGESVAVRVTQSLGESGLGIRIDAGGSHFAKSDAAYLVDGGGGDSATFTFRKSHAVEATHTRAPTWHWKRIL